MTKKEEIKEHLKLMTANERRSYVKRLLEGKETLPGTVIITDDPAEISRIQQLPFDAVIFLPRNGREQQ